MTAPGLSYVALVSRDVGAAQRLLGEVLGLSRTTLRTGQADVPVFAAGRSALALFAPGDAYVEGETRTGVHHVGLDYGGQPPGIATRGGASPALGGGERQALDPAATAGVRCFLASALDLPRGAPARIERRPSGTREAGLAPCWVPRPSQTGHQPSGALNEKWCGESSSKLRPQPSQLRCWL